jgi:hypothetical protein
VERKREKRSVKRKKEKIEMIRKKKEERKNKVEWNR